MSTADLTDLEREAFRFVGVFMRTLGQWDGLEAARSALRAAARHDATGMPPLANDDAFSERTRAIRPLLEAWEPLKDSTRHALEAAWEAGRSYGRGEGYPR